jgi:tetratricopeptide (TPR) repeat protein
MTLRFALLFSLLVALRAQAAPDYPAQFEKLLKAKNYKGALALTAQWRKAEPRNPQPNIEEANVYFSQAYKDAIGIVQKTPTGNDLVLTKDDDPKEQWVMTDAGSFDLQKTQKGIALLEMTVAQYPYRVDIWLGIAYAHQQLKQDDKMIGVLRRACAYTSAHPKGLVGRNGNPIQGSPEKFMVQCLQDYCVDFSQGGDPKGMERVLQLSQLMVKYYPKNAYGYDNIGGYFASKDDWKSAKTYYLKARDLAVGDSLEWNNLGSAYRHLGEKQEAIKCYKRVVEMNDNPQLVEEDGGWLKELQK